MTTGPQGVHWVIEGPITAHTAAPVWQAATDLLARHPNEPIVVDASRLGHTDVAGIALLFDLIRQERVSGASVQVQGLAPQLAEMLGGYAAPDFASSVLRPPHVGMLEEIGRATLRHAAYLKELAQFLGGCCRALSLVRRRPGAVHWDEVLDIATEAGANAVPIVLLMGFLMGVIIAFEVGLVARQFGAVIFVVNGVGVAMLRELGALMTAIVFAGRTGAAFAAQIGTQKVNEELNAICTFGLDPVESLVLPRVLAAVLVVPLLTMLADLVGLLGGALVMIRFHVGLLQFYTRMVVAVTPGDLILGLIKAMAFGLTIATVGCHQGLVTGAGATAVGLSTTRAVVISIVLIVVIDGLFAVLSS